MFHSTLRRTWELFDGLSMIYGTCILVWMLFEFRAVPAYNRWLPATLVLYSAVITYILYMNLQFNVPLFEIAYASLVVTMVWRSVSVVTSVKDGTLRSDLSRLLYRAGLVYGVGFILWNIDNNYCQELRHLKTMTNLPLSALFEFHGWWHIGSGFGTYIHIVFIQYYHQFAIGQGDMWEVRWFGPFLPVMMKKHKTRVM